MTQKMSVTEMQDFEGRAISALSKTLENCVFYMGENERAEKAEFTKKEAKATKGQHSFWANQLRDMVTLCADFCVMAKNSGVSVQEFGEACPKVYQVMDSLTDLPKDQTHDIGVLTKTLANIDMKSDQANVKANAFKSKSTGPKH
jgi:hypothetical protein